MDDQWWNNPFYSGMEPDPTMFAPRQSTELTAPDPYQPVYSEDQMRDPRRALWSGMLMDIGNSLLGGTASQLGQLRGTGFQQQNMAHRQNMRMQAANAGAKRQAWTDQNQYANQMYQREQADLNRQFQVDQQAALDAHRAAQLGLQRDTLAETKRKNRVAENVALAELEAEMTTAGYTPDEIKLVRDQRNDFNKTVADQKEVLTKGRQVLAGLQEGSGAGDIAALIGYYKSLDPGSVVSSGESEALQAASGLISKIKGYANKIKGGGVLSQGAREDIASAIHSLNQIAEAEYNANREETLARVSRFPNIDPTRIVGEPIDFTLPTYSAGQSSLAPSAFVPDETQPEPVYRPPIIGSMPFLGGS